MTELQDQLININERLSDIRSASYSVMDLKSAAQGDNGNFNDFFAKCYTAFLNQESNQKSGEMPLRHDAQWAMLFSYFQDLCEQVSIETRNDMVSKIDEGTFSMEDLASYCDRAIEVIKSNIKVIEEERAKIITQIARRTVLEVAA